MKNKIEKILLASAFVFVFTDVVNAGSFLGKKKGGESDQTKVEDDKDAKSDKKADKADAKNKKDEKDSSDEKSDGDKSGDAGDNQMESFLNQKGIVKKILLIIWDKLSKMEEKLEKMDAKLTSLTIVK